jgi:hypothetical protein
MNPKENLNTSHIAFDPFSQYSAGKDALRLLVDAPQSCSEQGRLP